MEWLDRIDNSIEFLRILLKILKSIRRVVTYYLFIRSTYKLVFFVNV